MREIKFRAWDNQAEKMIYSDEVYPMSKYKFEFDIFNDFEFKLMKMIDRYNVTDDEGNDTYQEVFKAVEADIMQYIGLKDKNGKEIYEGDIVEYEIDSPGLGEYFKGVVEFYNGFYYIKSKRTDNIMDLTDYETNNLTIIGNIYENPELLE